MGLWEQLQSGRAVLLGGRRKDGWTFVITSYSSPPVNMLGGKKSRYIVSWMSGNLRLGEPTIQINDKELGQA